MITTDTKEICATARCYNCPINIQTTIINGLKFSFVNKKEFNAVYKQIFKDGEYPYKIDKEKPFILDCGAHIGISVIYFKTLYPKSEIIAFEPNPLTYKLLEQNVKQNNLFGVTLINAAVGEKNGKIEFYVEKNEKDPWGWGDSAAINKWYDESKHKTIKVTSKNLSSFITRKVDLIKMDIEGTEEKVLKSIEKKLSKVDQIMMEFHGSSTNPENSEERILKLLDRNGFSYKTRTPGPKIMRIIRTDPYWLLIYAARTDK